MERALKRIVTVAIMILLLSTPTSYATYVHVATPGGLERTYPTAPQCWDRYSARNNPECNGGFAPGQFPGTAPGPDNGGGILGVIRRALGL